MAEERINYVELPDRNLVDSKTLELIDIEQPIKPGVDWLMWLELSVSLLLLFAMLWFVFWLGRQLWPGLQLQLKLKQAQKQLKQNAFEAYELKVVLFESFNQAKHKQLLSEKAVVYLSDKINRICFSSENVSHETLSATVDAFSLALKDGRLSIKQIIRNGWLRWQSQISQGENS